MYLGVDGGGSKTDLCLLESTGALAASARVGSSYYFGEDADLVGRVLGEGVREVCGEAGIDVGDIGYAFFGLPGYGEASGDVAFLDGLPRAILGHDRYACDNDMVCAWAGSLGAADGINVISGTGSMTYGERAGKGVRVGGWGEVFGDEGSAYWVAVRGLGAFSRMSDGRLERGPLHGLLRERLALEKDLDLVDVVLNGWKAERGRIAALSRLVADAADRGDEQAAGILDAASAELVDLVEATRSRLGFGPGEEVAVSYAGGMFGASRVAGGFAEALPALYEGYVLREPLFSPVVGAALYAAKLAGNPLDEGALAELMGARGEPGVDEPKKEET